MCSALGVPEEKILALEDYAASPLYTSTESTVLEYADAMTRSDVDVDDDLFARLSEILGEDEIIELTAAIAWENASSKFNRALRIESQGLWKRSS